MDGTTRFRLNSPSVIAETVDGELLVVNLDSGAYFSARGSAEYVWSLAAAGHSIDAIVSSARAAYDGEATIISTAVTDFISLVLAEGLLQVNRADRLPGEVPQPATFVPFSPPQLEKFTDMQELLVLDPVHEVDETGWPHAREAPGAV